MISDEESLIRKASQDLSTVDGIVSLKRSFIHNTPSEVPENWSNTSQETITMSTPKKKNNQSFFKKIFLGSFGFFVIAILVATFFFIQGVNTISSRNVDVLITTRSFVDGGESFPVTVTLRNNNRTPLELATLTLEFPEGNQVNPNATRILTRDIESINSGATRQEVFDLTLFGEEGSIRPIAARLSFRVSGSNAIYTAENNSDIVIRSSPVRLVTTIPDSVIPNQETTLTFSVSGNGTSVLSQTALVLEYPQGFSFIRSNPAPSLDTSIWILGDIPPTGSRTVSITGIFTGSSQELKTIRASVGIQDSRNERLLSTVYNSVSQIIPLTTAFLDLELRVLNDSGSSVAISSTTSTQVEILWRNTLDTQINNAEINVALSGGAYDPLRIQPSSGFFDSATNTVIWTRQQNPALASIPPGGSGRLSFSLSPKISGLGSNPSINLSASISGFDNSGARLTAMNVAQKRLVLNSDLNLSVRTLYYSGPFQNTGPIPPRVGQETTYTLEFQVTNSRNRVTDTVVATTLPLWASWKDVVIPLSERNNVTYNTVTRELVWNVGELAPGALVAKTLSIKVGVVPTANQTGGAVALTNDVVISGQDTVTGNTLSFSRRALTSQLINDSSDVGAGGQVQP